MQMATAPKKERLEFRCSSRQRELIDNAVRLCGRSVTDFVLDAVQEAAMETVKSFEAMKVNAQDSATLAKALLKPPNPNAKLRAAARRYKAATS
jgi:uncharacterized protein (DUF1778 family)